MTKSPSPFEIESAPLTGVHLIEAGAGTGKTHTIAELYLRFLVEEEIGVDRILVVTYTKAATAELTERIRRRILEVRNSLDLGRQSAPFAHDPFRGKKDPGRIIALCEAALADFDRAAIFTIHGFCLRVLQECAFETGYPFDTQLSADISEIVQEAAEDFWRRRIASLAPEVVALLGIDSPQSLVALLRGNRRALRILPEPGTDCGKESKAASSGFEEALEALGAIWESQRGTVWDLLIHAPLNGTGYGKYQPAAQGTEISGREKKVAKWMAEVDRLLAHRRPTPDAETALQKLSQDVLCDSTLKKHPPPKHPVFERCEALRVAASAAAERAKDLEIRLKRAFFTTIDAVLKEKKEALNLQSYDDLLTRVHDALVDPEKGPRVVQVLSRQYPVALVDEFQDTDPVQYDIFRSFTDDPASALFMIGDPKQAIYGFRGADLFSYMAAGKAAGYHHALTRNWRASASLIKAVNTVFASVSRPFVFPAIDFIAATPAVADAGETTPALTLRYIPNPDTRAFSKEKAEAVMTEATVEEILRTLSRPVEDQTPVRPGDIAVLVRTNDQAARVKAALAEYGIASVLWSTDCVFESREAEQMRRFMSAVADPGAMHRVKSAFITDLMGGRLLDVERLDTDPMEAGRLVVKFDALRQSMEKRGFLRTFGRFLREEKVQERLLALPGGERRLTNVLHLCELMHAAQTERDLRASGLLRWLTHQMDRKPEASESAQLRLESDAQSLKIVTIHKAKGLEYPIVLCPFTWNGSETKDAHVLYHDPEREDRLTLHLCPSSRPEARGLADAEILAENLRLFYVALTRAKKRCWIALSRVRGDETSAPAYLFHCDTGPEVALGRVVETLKTALSGKMTDADRIEDLKALEAHSGGTIRLDCRPMSALCSNPAPDGETQPDLECRHFTGEIDPGLRITSYSALAAARQEVDEPRDHDGHLPPGFQEPFPITEPAQGSLSGFPGGTKAGTMIHGVFERIDFQDPDCAANREIILRDLKKYGFEQAWAPALSRMVEEVLTTPLPVTGGPRLQWVPRESRVHEMAFFYPIRLLTGQSMAELLHRAAKAGWVSERVAGTFETLSFSPIRGILTGVMDLIFEWEGRFYLCDWKSNDLGPGPSDYHEERLFEEMALHRYHLQYYLYTLALHRFLAGKLQAYDYERHFGGVMYLFIRGMRPESGAGSGVYFDRPELELVREMERRWLLSP